MRVGAGRLRIITGVFCMKSAKPFGMAENVDLTVGMCIRDMLFRPVHEGFRAFTGSANYTQLTAKLSSFILSRGHQWAEDGKHPPHAPISAPSYKLLR